LFILRPCPIFIFVSTKLGCAMTQVKLSVSGMKCGGCINKATKALSGLKGFETAEFDLEQGTALVTGDLSEQAVIQVLTDTGYPASKQS
jgi:copper chaperone